METIQVEKDKAELLKQLSSLSVQSLEILADASKSPGIESKLKTYAPFLKSFIKK